MTLREGDSVELINLNSATCPVVKVAMKGNLATVVKVRSEDVAIAFKNRGSFYALKSELRLVKPITFCPTCGNPHHRGQS